MSEALKLADELSTDYYADVRVTAAAAELRRLHAENEALREANEAFGKRQEWWNDKMIAIEERNAELMEALLRIAGRCDAEPMHKIARAALAKVEDAAIRSRK